MTTYQAFLLGWASGLVVWAIALTGAKRRSHKTREPSLWQRLTKMV